MLTEGQKKLRRTGITATDAAAIVGLSKWRTAGDIWVEKKHPETIDPPKLETQNRFDWGHRHEVTIALAYADRMHCELKEVGTLRHDTCHWMLATPDRLVLNRRKGVECKSSDDQYTEESEWGNDGTDVIPPIYIIQIAHLMMTLGYEEWDCAALVGLYDFRVYHLFQNDDMNEIQCALFDKEEEFYKRFLKGNEVPKDDFGVEFSDWINQKYPKPDPQKVLDISSGSDPALTHALLEHRRARKEIEAADELRQKQRLTIATTMAECTKLKWRDEGISASFKYGKANEQMDWQGLAEEAMAKLEQPVEERKQMYLRHRVERQPQRVLRIRDKHIKEKEE